MTKDEKTKLLLRELAKRGASTTNEIIDHLFSKDLKKGYDFVIKRGWRFYVHLNKHFTDFEGDGYIIHKGSIKGPTGKAEKVWIPTIKTITIFGTTTVKKTKIKDKIKQSLLKYKLKRKKGK